MTGPAREVYNFKDMNEVVIKTNGSEWISEKGL